MKKDIYFNDVEKNKVHLGIELKENKFSISGDCGASCGQCYDSIKPTRTQTKIIEIWKKYHLNDMNAGTPEQEEALKSFKGDYTEQNEYLKSVGLYEVKLEDGTLYKYGSAWLTRDLPKDIWKQVCLICDQIEAEQQEYKEKLKGGNWEDLDNKIVALGKFLEMTPKEAEENISECSYNSDLLEAEGISYHVGDEHTINEACETSLTDDTYIYQSYIEREIENGSASSIMNIDDWAEHCISSDGFGHILNGWDGSEHYDDDLKLYVIRS